MGVAGSAVVASTVNRQAPVPVGLRQCWIPCSLHRRLTDPALPAHPRWTPSLRRNACDRLTHLRMPLHCAPCRSRTRLSTCCNPDIATCCTARTLRVARNDGECAIASGSSVIVSSAIVSRSTSKAGTRNRRLRSMARNRRVANVSRRQVGRVRAAIHQQADDRGEACPAHPQSRNEQGCDGRQCDQCILLAGFALGRVLRGAAAAGRTWRSWWCSNSGRWRNITCNAACNATGYTANNARQHHCGQHRRSWSRTCDTQSASL